MLGKPGDDRGEFCVAFDLHVLHDRRLAALQEGRQRVGRHRHRDVELLGLTFLDRGEIAVRLDHEHQGDGRTGESGGFASVGSEALACPRFAGEQMVDGSSEGLGGEGHRKWKEKPAPAMCLRGFLL